MSLVHPGVPCRSAGEPTGSVDQPLEDWPFLKQAVLLPRRSRRVCLTCHWFRFHSAPQCIPARTTDEPRLLVIGLIGGKHWSAVITYRGQTIRRLSVRRSRAEEVQLYEQL